MIPSIPKTIADFLFFEIPLRQPVLKTEVYDTGESIEINGQIEQIKNTRFWLEEYLFEKVGLKIKVPSEVGNLEREILRLGQYHEVYVDVRGEFPDAEYIILPDIFFTHGTPYAVNKELDNRVSYPIVYLLEIINEEIPSNLDSRFSSIPIVRLFFLDEANFMDWDTNELYSNVVEPQNVFATYVLEKIKESKRFGMPSQITKTAFPKFGVYTNNKGVENSLFNKTLSGVELRMVLPIVKPSTCN